MFRRLPNNKRCYIFPSIQQLYRISQGTGIDLAVHPADRVGAGGRQIGDGLNRNTPSGEVADEGVFQHMRGHILEPRPLDGACEGVFDVADSFAAVLHHIL